MKKGNALQFSADGTEFVFLFSSGIESAAFTSKKTGFAAVTDLAQKGKISVEEFSKFRDEILDAENLVWEDSEPERISFLGLLIGMAMSSSGSSILDQMHAPEEPVTIAYLKMCDCGGSHGRIYCKTAYTGRLDSKGEASVYLNELKKKGLVDDVEFEKVKSEIENSGLDLDE